MEVKLHASFVKISRVEIIRLGLFKEIWGFKRLNNSFEGFSSKQFEPLIKIKIGLEWFKKYSKTALFGTLFVKFKRKLKLT